MFDTEGSQSEDYKVMIQAAALGIKSGVKNGPLDLVEGEGINKETIDDIKKELGDEVKVEEKQIRAGEWGPVITVMMEPYRKPGESELKKPMTDAEREEYYQREGHGPRGNVITGEVPIGPQKTVIRSGFRFTKVEKAQVDGFTDEQVDALINNAESGPEGQLAPVKDAKKEATVQNPVGTVKSQSEVSK